MDELIARISSLLRCDTRLNQKDGFINSMTEDEEDEDNECEEGEDEE